jgi:hypothetical protein
VQAPTIGHLSQEGEGIPVGTTVAVWKAKLKKKELRILPTTIPETTGSTNDDKKFKLHEAIVVPTVAQQRGRGESTD